jgi:hypothetical protein
MLLTLLISKILITRILKTAAYTKFASFDYPYIGKGDVLALLADLLSQW